MHLKAVPASTDTCFANVYGKKSYIWLMGKAVRLVVHPDNPQIRSLKQAAEILTKGGLVVYPTDSGYAVGCSADSHHGIQRLYQLKKPMKKFVMALLFQDFSKASEYAIIDNYAYRIIKGRIPGPYTFILPADYHIARKLDVKRPEIGCRWPKHPATQGILEALGCPLVNSAAKLDETQILTNPDEIYELFAGHVDLMIDAGEVPINPTNIVKIGNGSVEVIRGEFS